MKKYIFSFLVFLIPLFCYSQTGSVNSYQVISSTSGNFNMPLSSNERFGTSVDTIGDLNNDGITDLIVGAPNDDDGGTNSGAVFILFMRTNRTVKYVKKISRISGNFSNNGISNGNLFGRGVGGIGDINNDGIPDIVVGAENDAEGGSSTGSIRIIFLDTNGTVKGFQKISIYHGYGSSGIPIASGTKFGIDVSLIGDIDNDGTNDIVVSNFWDNAGGSGKGAIWVLRLFSTGKVKSYQKIYDGITNFNAPINNGDYFGVSVSGLGDFDNDGVEDILAGAYLDDEGGTNNGSVYIILLNSTGTVKGYHKISNYTIGALYNQVPSNMQFGVNVAGIRDIDGNGVKDLIVGCLNYNNSQYGAAYIVLMNSNGQAGGKYFINHNNGISNINSGDRFGFGVSGYKDIDNDGYPEVIAGAPFDDDGGSSKGSIYIISIKTAFKLAIQKSNSSCANIPVGTAKAIPTLGTAPYSYLWSTGATADSIYGLSPGTYTVTVTDATNKHQVRSVNIVSAPAVNIVTSNNYTMCSGSTTSVMAIASGGSGSGYAYHWNQGLSGSNLHSVSPTTTTTYTIFATDGNNCHSDTSDIIITVNPITTPSASGLNVAYCADDNSAALLGSPSGGSFSGSGVSGNSSSGFTFDPSNANTGQVNVIYSYTNSYGCVGRDTLTTQVYPIPNIQFNGIATSYCQNNANVTLSASPTGGSFAINNTPATVFSPSTLGLGTYKIKYSVTTTAGCSNSDSLITYVNPITTATLSGLATAYCQNSGAATLLGTPAGGSFLPATGLSGTTFNPSIAGVGQHTLAYKYTNFYGCTDTAFQTTTINPSSPLTISSPKTTFCNDDAMATISVSPTGGTLTGPGVTNANKTFNPITAGLGTKTIIYTFTNPYGCTSTDSILLTVNSPATLNISGLASAYCVNNETVNITGYPSGGSFNGMGVSGNTFNPAATGTGLKIVSYVYNNGCIDTVFQNVTINGLPSVSFSGLANDYCENANVVSLIGSPTNGTFYGSGISGNSFTPSNAGVGTKTISYISPLDANGCKDTTTLQTHIHALPNINFGNMVADQCISSNSVSLSATPTGGSFSGTAVSGSVFNPSQAGLGQSKIYYSYADNYGCSNTDSLTFVVHSLPSITFNVGQSCANISAMNLSASPSGGTFSGANVSGSIFSPSAAGIGSHQVIYSFTDGYGCANADTEQVVVNALPSLNFSLSQNNLCINGSPISLSATPSGGSFSGTAVSGTTFNPITAGQGSHDIIYSYTDANLCSNSDTEAVVVHSLPTISFGSVTADQCINGQAVTLSATPIGGSFSGTAVLGSVFNPSQAGLGQTKVYYSYTNSYNCSNTDSLIFTIHNLPSITFNVGQSCANISAMNLSASPSGGTFSGANVSGSIFSPSAAGIGSHQVIYSFTDGYGCANADTEQVVVNALPSLNFSLSQNNLCINGSPISLSATPSGGSFSGTAVSGTTFNPITAGLGSHDIIYSYTDANLCSNSDTEIVVVHNLPSISFGAMDSTYCSSNTPDTLVALPQGGSFTGAGIIGNLFITSIAGAGQHWIYYNYSDSYGCSNSDSTMVVIFPQPSVSFSGLSLNYCLNSSIDTLSPSPIGGYFSGAGISNNLFNPANAGQGNHLISYYFTDTNNCSVNVMQSTTVNDVPMANAGKDTLIPCNTMGLQIGQNPQSNLSYYWQPSTGLNNVNQANPTANPLSTTTYIFTVNNIQTQCKAYDTITISLPAGPNLIISGNTEICQNDTTILTASGGLTYQWQTPNLDTTASVVLSPFYTSSYSVTSWDSMMCSSHDSIILIVNPLPQPNIGFDTVNMASYDSLLITPGNFLSYLWSNGDTFHSIYVYPGNAFSTFWVIVTDSNGCRAKDSIYLYIESLQEIVSNLKVSLYPNPSRDNAYVEFNQAVKLSVWELYDEMGRLISREEITGMTLGFKVGVSTLPRGKYYLRLVFGDKDRSLPLFVQ